MGADGMIWVSTAKATVGLIVRGGKVVDCPPYAKRWALGRDARELWRETVAKGALVVDPGQPVPATNRTVLAWCPQPKKWTVGHWWNGRWGNLGRRDIWLRTDGAEWEVEVVQGVDEKARRALRFYDSEAGARADVGNVVEAAGGEWKELPVSDLQRSTEQAGVRPAGGDDASAPPA